MTKLAWEAVFTRGADLRFAEIRELSLDSGRVGVQQDATQKVASAGPVERPPVVDTTSIEAKPTPVTKSEHATNLVIAVTDKGFEKRLNSQQNS